MANIADITIKKSDLTTDIIYAGLVGSGGDGTWATWRQDAGQPASFPTGFRPKFELMTKYNGPKTARQVQYKYSYPVAYLDSTTGVYKSSDKVYGEGFLTLPLSASPNVCWEAAFEMAHMVASAAVKTVFGNGFNVT